ncbi:MAG: C25 family cysteine peptidase [Patescibacteria group bacterium]
MSGKYMTKIQTKNKIKLSIKILMAISASALVLSAGFAIFRFQTIKQSGITSGEYIFETKITDLSRKTVTDPEGNNYIFIQSPESSYLNEAGKPKVPVQNYKVEIPKDAKNLKIEVVNSIDEQERIDAHYYPAEELVQKSIDENVEYIDEEFYIDNNFYDEYQEIYPKNPVVIGQTGKMREVNFVEILFYPLQYKPSDKTLVTNRKLTAKLTYTSENGKETISLPSSFKSIGKGILNHEEEVDAPATSRLGAVIYPTDLASSSNVANYLIITADLFYDNIPDNDDPIEQLVEHRSEISNYDVAVVQLSDIVASYGASIPIHPDLIDTDDDLDLKIKNFIKYAYENWNSGQPDLEYILMVGDAAPETEEFFLPMHLSTIESYGERILTDHWYICINDDQASPQIDDMDVIGDIILGRFSVQTETDLSTVVNKTINYELNPPPDNDWGNRTLLTSGFEEGDGGLPIIRDEILIPNGLEANEVYADDYTDYQLAINDILANINYGHSFFVHHGHGWPYGWQIGDVYSITTDDIGNLSNDNRLPVVFSMSCSTAKIDSDDPSLAETFVNGIEGSIAFFGATRIADSSGFSLAIYTMQQIFEEGEYRLGASILKAKSFSNSGLVYNLFGDPALDLSQSILSSDKPDFRTTLEGFDYSGENVTFFATIYNKGLTAGENVKAELFIGHPELGGTVIDDSTTFHTIPALSNLPIEITIPLQEGWDHGYSTELYLVIDSQNEIEELSEHNNISNQLAFFLNFLPNYYIGGGYGPSIYDNKLVWTENHDGIFSSINMFDLGNDGKYGTADDSGVIQITEDNRNSYHPSIYGNKIVWYGDTNDGQLGISLYNLGQDGLFGTSDDSGVITIAQGGDKKYPKIFGNKIVWQKADSYDYLYIFDLGNDGVYGTSDDRGPSRISSFPLDYSDSFSFRDNKILWSSLNYPDDMIEDVFLYDLGDDGIFGTNDDIKDVQITNNNMNASKPNLYGKKILMSSYIFNLGDDGIFGTDDDLGEITIDRISLESEDNYIPVDYNIEIFSDNQWSVILEVEGNSDPQILHYLPEIVTFSKVRFNFTDTYDTEPDHEELRIYDIELLNSETGKLYSDHGYVSASAGNNPNYIHESYGTAFWQVINSDPFWLEVQFRDIANINDEITQINSEIYLSLNDIFANVVVGENLFDNPNIYTYDLVSGSLNQITARPINQQRIKVWGNKIVYTGEGDLEGIFLTEYFSCDNSNPAVCGEAFGPDCQEVDQLMCCEDDTDENYLSRDCADSSIFADSCSDEENDNACCDDSKDCVYKGICYTRNRANDFQENAWEGTNGAGTVGYYKCLNTPGMIFDCDHDPYVCEEYNWACNVDETRPYGRSAGWAFEGEDHTFGGYGDSWGRGIGVWGSYDQGPSSVINHEFEECCGDDVGEYLIGNICCDSPNDRIDNSGNCVPRGKPKRIQEMSLRNNTYSQLGINVTAAKF